MRRVARLSAALLAAGIMISLCAEERRKPPPPPKKEKAPPQKATAAQLASDAERAIAFMAREVKDCKDGSLDLKNVKLQPFFSALRKTEEVVAKIQDQLDDHSLSVFETINEGTQVAAELKSALPRSGIKNAKINEGVKVISNALTLLRRNYGREAVHRKRNTGGLSEKEKDEFAQLKESERKLVAQFEMLAEDVKDNKNLSAELARLISQLKKNIDAPMTPDSLYSSLELMDVLQGEWEAWSYFVDPKNREAWTDAREDESFKVIEDLTAKQAKEIDFENWEFMDEEVEFPASVDVTVEIEIDEVEGYILFVEESVEGVEITLYYEEADDIEMTDEEYQEFPDDLDMQLNLPQEPEEPEEQQQQ